jgi:cation:H+ antiporter
VLAGAEPEEMVTAVFASAAHHPGIAAGDAIGANVTMLTLVLGLAALVRPLRFTGRVRGYALGAPAAGAAAAIAVAGGSIGRAAGALLTGLYVLAVAVIWRLERRVVEVQLSQRGQQHDAGAGLNWRRSGRRKGSRGWETTDADTDDRAAGCGQGDAGRADRGPFRHPTHRGG